MIHPHKGSILRAVMQDARAADLAAVLDRCPYLEVRDRMLDIELVYGDGRRGVPPELAFEIGKRLRARPDYHLLVARNGA